MMLRKGAGDHVVASTLSLSRSNRRMAPLVLCSLAVLQASAAASDEPLPIGRDVSPPVPVYKPEPEYSEEARRAHVQGSVLLGIVIDSDGRTRNIEVISPAGFGLDEKAVEAVGKWRFKPAKKDGKPVFVTANVEVNFRLLGEYFSEEQERRRRAYNAAVTAVNKKEKAEAVQRAHETLRKLADEKYAAAQQVLGSWYLHGSEGLEKDPARGITLLKAAAKEHNGNAIFELGRLKIKEQDTPDAQREGLQMIQEASVLGSVPAQAFLAQAYYNGEGVEKDHERARRYLRLCGARGIAGCQSLLGRMLLESSRERERLQGLAWLHLAAEAGERKASDVLPQESAKLTDEQKNWVAKLKSQLLRRAD
jgi:TonB family protein